MANGNSQFAVTQHSRCHVGDHNLGIADANEHQSRRTLAAVMAAVPGLSAEPDCMSHALTARLFVTLPAAPELPQRLAAAMRTCKQEGGRFSSKELRSMSQKEAGSGRSRPGRRIPMERSAVRRASLRTRELSFDACAAESTSRCDEARESAVHHPKNARHQLCYVPRTSLPITLLDNQLGTLLFDQRLQLIQQLLVKLSDCFDKVRQV